MSMKQQTKRFIHNANQFLNQPIAVVFTLLLLFAYFAVGNAQFQKDNRQILEGVATTQQGTKNILSKQDETLKAIKDVTTDTRLTAAKQTDIIICMLQVPVNQRTTDLQAQCRKQTEATAFASVAQTSPSVTATPKSNQNTSQATNGQTPSNNTDSGGNQVQPKLLNCRVDLLGLHLGCPSFNN